MSDNIFQDDWQDCLRAHYMHVIRTEDKVTLPSLTVVMGQAGFNASDLAELRVRATMHVDDSSTDFVPDMNVLNAVAEVQEHPEAHIFPVPEMPAETVEVMPEPEMMLEAESVDELPSDEAEVVVDEQPEETPPDEDAPKQLSLF